MKRFLTAFVVLAGVLTLSAQIPDGSGMVIPTRPTPSAAVASVAATADAEQDMMSLQKDLKVLTLRVEELERQKAEIEAKLNSADTTTFATKEELKLSESKNRDAIAAEGKRVETAILEEIKAAKSAIATKSADISGAIPASTSTASASVTTKAVAASSKLLAPATPEEKAAFMKEGVRHTVAAGDTLSSIARQYRSTMRAIVVANEITNPNKLLVGHELFVPTTSK